MRDHAFLTEVLPLSNGIDIAAYEPRPDETVQKNPYPTVLFAGRLAEEKHVDVLIRAIAKTPAELDVHLEIVGGGEVRPSLEKLVDSLGVRDRVRFLGLAPDDELRLAYLRADLFCMPGTAELQSLVTLEAMSASTPVVLADAMALPHLVADGENGYLFRPNDADDLASKITAVLGQPEQELARMGAESHRMVQKHGLKATLDTFEALYRGTDLGGDLA
jgi:glycosyltransferase involved in cell wall biosynthesis